MASLQPLGGLLGDQRASHLLRRSTFGFTAADVASFAQKTPGQAVDDLLNFPTVPPPPKDPATGASWIPGGTTSNSSSGDTLRSIILTWWLDESFTTTSLAQKMMLFLHQNFVNNLSVRSTDLYYQLSLFRKYAKGSYKTLAEKMCMDNSMLVYLNSQQSSRTSPNENFPRELLELFTIGKGPQVAPGNYTTYTEDDIKEASRLFTGFRMDLTRNTLDPDTGFPMGDTNTWKHDATNKTFSPAFGNTVIQGRSTASGMIDEQKDFITMVFNQKATALNICRKLYRFFVHHDITSEVESDIIDPLATLLKTNNYNLDPVLKKLFKSEHFYDKDDTVEGDEVIGGLIKSPLDLFLGTMQYFQIPLPDKVTDPNTYYRSFFKNVFFGYLCIEAGMEVYNPIDVAGYPAYYQQPAMDDLWVSGTTLSFRYLFADMLISGTKELSTNSLIIQLDAMAFVNNPQNIPAYSGADAFGNPGPHPGPQVAGHLVDTLVKALFPRPIEQARRDYFLNDLLLGNLSERNWHFEWLNYVATGNDATVKPQIESLIRGIIQSPEYQLG